jgi:hypothetical protein
MLFTIQLRPTPKTYNSRPDPLPFILPFRAVRLEEWVVVLARRQGGTQLPHEGIVL